VGTEQDSIKGKASRGPQVL